MLRLDMHMIAGVLQYVAVASFAEAWIEKLIYVLLSVCFLVASFAEAWIENVSIHNMQDKYHVASFAEAWIENVLLLFCFHGL